MKLHVSGLRLLAACTLAAWGGPWPKAHAQAVTGAATGPGAAAGTSPDEAGPDRASLAPAPPPPADTVLPRIGIGDDLPGIDDHVLDALQTDPVANPAGTQSRSGLQIDTQVGVSEEFTDNAGASIGSGRSGYDFITLIQPAVHVSDVTQRLRVDVSYAPTGQIYARNGGFSQFEQTANGDVLGTLLPGWLYVDVRGSINQQSVYGGYGTTNAVGLSPDNRETVSSVSISPYVTHSFGSTGTAQAGVAYIYSATDAPGSAQLGAPGAAPFGFGGGNYGSSYLGTERAYANVTTGPDFGRLLDRAGVDANLYDGSGVLRNARRITVTDDVSYAITRLVALLGQAGYEDLAYPASGFRYSGPIGAGGVRLTPNRDSKLTIEYRYIDGFGSALVQGSVQVTPRIRISGGYSEGISTAEQDLQDTLLSGTADEQGALGSAVLGTPLLGGGGGAFGGNQDLQRLRRLDATLSYVRDLDTISLTVQHEETTPVGRPLPGVLNAPTSGTYGTVSWRRPLTPTTGLSATAQYGSNTTALLDTSGHALSSDTASFSVQLDHSYSDTLSAYIRVGGTYVLGGYQNFGGQDGNQDYVIAGAVKRF